MFGAMLKFNCGIFGSKDKSWAALTGNIMPSPPSAGIKM